MSDFVTKPDELPDFPYFVVALDTFMSGWGQSKDRDNWVILPCNDLDEANVVGENAGRRTDMTSVALRTKKDMPEFFFTKSRATFSLFDREDADRWYTPGGFSGNRAG